MPDKKSKKGKRNKKSKKGKKRHGKRTGKSLGKSTRCSQMERNIAALKPKSVASKKSFKKTTSSRGRKPRSGPAIHQKVTKSRPKTNQSARKKSSRKSLPKITAAKEKTPVICKESSAFPKLPEKQVETILIAPKDYIPM